MDENLRFLAGSMPAAGTREYAERLTRLRLHQPVFRTRVLPADEQACAICRLKHVDLLDAAHLLSDVAGGRPVVPNGLSCARSTTPSRCDWTLQVL